jgi:hypothetical protein
LSAAPPERIAPLAALYDRFAQALDPFAPERDQAELLCDQEVATLYDALAGPKPRFQAFKKAVILRCRRHLRATDKPASP